jgi:formylglycine-generating enzyme required for sulfatase activity
LPNDLRLFDMLGNEWEWVHDRLDVTRPRHNRLYYDHIKILESIDDKTPRLLRGGTFNNPAANVRSADRNWYAPSVRSTDFGFRPARTYD